jgi:hypothetical protein
MKYITKIGLDHIVELNGRNIRVTESKDDYSVQLDENNAYIDICVNKVTYTLKGSGKAEGFFLDEYVVALELVRVIEESI